MDEDLKLAWEIDAKRTTRFNAIFSTLFCGLLLGGLYAHYLIH
jgi:hypothetical protein